MSRRVGEVLFIAIPCDDSRAELAHLHAAVGEGEVALELLPGGEVCLSAAHGDPIRGTVTPPELKIVLDTARGAHAELVAFSKAR